MKNRLYVVAMVLGVLYAGVALAQTLTTDAPAEQKLWEVILKMAFPVVMTVVGPLVTGFMKTAPPWVKYVSASLASMLVGAGVGTIDSFPLTSESAATIGATSGAMGQALFLQKPQPPSGSGPTTLSAFWIPLFLLTLLSACTTVHDLGGGRYVVPRTAEVRSPFGTNMGAIMLQTCDGSKNPYFPWQTDYRNCQDLLDHWTAFSSQGQGGQVAAGALVGLGFGLGSAFAPVSGASANASQSQSLAVSGASAPAKGHH